MDARFQDEATETYTKAELAADNNVIPDDDVALPSTGVVKDYVDHVVETDILVNSTGLEKTASNGQVTLGIAAGSVDLDRIKAADIITSSESNPNNDITIATTAKIDDMIDAAITGDIAGSDGVSITNDGDGTITVGLSDSSVDLDKIKDADKITYAEQDAGSPTPADTNIFTASASARRFDTIVQTTTPTGSDWETGKTWLQNDDDQTLKIWNGSTWLDVASGGSFRTQDKVIYVDATGGDDSKTGHRISGPKLTIKGAINDINADISTSIKTAGSGYTNGSYTNVPITGGTTGSGLQADITVSGGAVTACTVTSASTLEEYQIGDILSAADSNLGGGGGSGFELEVTGGGDGMTVIVSAGVYQEAGPIQIKRRNVSIIGMALRSCIVHPTVATQGDHADGNHALFELNSGSFIQNLTLTGMKASSSGTNTLDSVLPTRQGWNFAFYNNCYITKSPYIQNCTNFSDSEIDNNDLRAHRPRGGSAGDTDSAPTGGGMLINGATPKTTSPLRSMVADSYTHVGLNGPGILVTNNGYAQCTSSYAFFNKYHIKALNGGQANLAASTTDFGDEALVADGKSSAAIFTSTVDGAAADNDTTFNIDAPTAGTGWFGDAMRPGSNMLVTVNSVTYPVLSAAANGSGWTVTISRPNPNKRSENLGLNGAIADGAAVSFFLRSMIASSGHTMEYVGSGTNYNALPENGGVPNTAKQIVESNDGKIWTATTDHNGRFAVGDFFAVDQRTGEIEFSGGSVAFDLVTDETPELGGQLDALNNKIVNLADPTAAQDAATKAYVDASGIPDKIEEGNTKAEVVDTGSDGHFKVETEGAERLRIDSSGNLGVGTASPSAKLHSVVVSGEAIRASASGAAQHVWSRYVGGSGNSADLKVGVDSSAGGVYGVGGGGVVWNAGNGPLGFGTNDTERMRIDSSGRLLIGTSSSLAQYGAQPSLQVAGTGFDSSTLSVRRDSNNANPPAIILAKSRGSLGGNTVVQNNDKIGELNFAAADGTDVTTLAGQIKVEIDGTPGSNDMPGRLVFSTTADGASSPTERMRIDSLGNVAIGSSSVNSSRKVEITQPNGYAAGLRIMHGGSGAYNQFFSGVSNWRVGSPQSANALTFDEGSTSTERMRIDSSGRVGINQSSPATKLPVDGGSTGYAFPIDNGGYGTSRMGAASNGGNLISVGTGEKLIFGHQSAPGTSYTERMRIDSSGKVGIGQTSPAAKLDVNGNYTSNVTAVAALAIDCSAGNYFTKTINANSTFTFSNVPSSRSYSFTLELTHTSGTVTWPSSVKFPADTAPTLTTGKTHLFVFVTDDGGTRFRGAALADYVN